MLFILLYSQSVFVFLLDGFLRLFYCVFLLDKFHVAVYYQINNGGLTVPIVVIIRGARLASVSQLSRSTRSGGGFIGVRRVAHASDSEWNPRAARLAGISLSVKWSERQGGSITMSPPPCLPQCDTSRLPCPVNILPFLYVACKLCTVLVVIIIVIAAPLFLTGLIFYNTIYYLQMYTQRAISVRMKFVYRN